MPKIGVGVYPIFNPGVRQDFADLASGPQLDMDPITLAAGLLATWPNNGSAVASPNQFTAAGTNRPTVVATDLNGRATVEFDGAADPDGDVMSADASLIHSDISSASGYTQFFVLKLDACETNTLQPADNDAVLSCGNEFQGVHFKEVAGVPSVIGYHFDGVQKADATAMTYGAWTLIQVRYDGMKIYTRVGAGAESAGTAAGNVSNLAGAVRIGRNYTTRYFDGKIARILGYNTNISTANINLIRARLAALYGVAA